MAVVNKLKTIREERGLLQEDLASATGFCTKTIGRVERGERAPSAEFMLRIAAYFNLLVEDRKSPLRKGFLPSQRTTRQTEIYLLTLLTFPYFQGFPPLKILYMYPFPLFLPLWDNYKGKFIIQLFNRCLPLYQEVLRKSALLPL